MKASEMVHRLRQLQSNHGDLEVVDDGGNPVDLEFSEGVKDVDEDAFVVS